MATKFVEDFEAIFGRKPEESEPAETIQPVAEPAVVETKVVTAPQPVPVAPATVAEVQ